MAWLYQFRQEVEATQEQAEALIALSHEHGFTLHEARATTCRGWALAKQGRNDEGIAQIRQGLAASQATGAEVSQPHQFTLLAEACGEAGQPEEGLTALTDALDLASRTGCVYYEPESYRLKGELLIMRDGSSAAQAESCFQRAVQGARKQGAKFFELRATTSLARLLAHQGRGDEARLMLAEIYAWFTAGFDTADLKEAKEMLDELSR